MYHPMFLNSTMHDPSPPWSGGDPTAAALLHGEPASAQHLPDGDGHRGLLLAPRQRGEGLFQGDAAAGLLRLPHHRVRHAARHRHRNPPHRHVNIAHYHRIMQSMMYVIYQQQDNHS